MASSSSDWNISRHSKKFRPPSKEWQINTARRLRLNVDYYLRYGSDKTFNNQSAPKLTASVRADGNCFFRALSVLICGTEEHHMAIREAITRHVEDHSDIYRTFLQSRGGMQNYVRSMRRAREWATDTEIFAAATYLKTVIEVCTSNRTQKGMEYQWQTFYPLNDHHASLPCVYISHKDEHFEPILDVEGVRR